jgi:hypothetical protein
MLRTPVLEHSQLEKVETKWEGAWVKRVFFPNPQTPQVNGNTRALSGTYFWFSTHLLLAPALMSLRPQKGT